MVKAARGMRPITILDEILRRHSELWTGIRRTLVRRIRGWRSLRGEEREVIFRQTHELGDAYLPSTVAPDSDEMAVTITLGTGAMNVDVVTTSRT
ncbi:hypothetical protein EAS61_40690 [Bradyrhizobium zhanjiangense]|uniref:Uncharacterized protein n=1 Tax=Bradyrhizobium zhanjiangense TaxID=1325107 RepID=A0A4V1KUD6_9BRAD|nr:hypothetical protein EAS61_40690 [Bradyrhizobium zhanjiangense]